MKVEKNKWVTIHYTLKDDEGNQLDSSAGGDPLGYLHGNGYLILGLENELEGKNPGDKFSAVIKPKDGYGEYDSRLIVDIPRGQFEIDQPIEVGMQFQLMTRMGPSIVKVIEVNGEQIKVDGNHELAGKVLHFDVAVVDVRDATEDELNPRGCGGGCGSCGGCGDSGCDSCGGGRGGCN